MTETFAMLLAGGAFLLIAGVVFAVKIPTKDKKRKDDPKR